ncbi:MAG TPA: DinB family protein [Ktedonobacterales bacterium]|nr:DinB family protein [Ktedonobacterales bacterium]
MSESTTEDLIAQLASVPDQLEAALPANVSNPPTPGATNGATTGEESWTTSEILGHLCDAARYWGGRMRLAVYEERPRLEAFDQDALVRLAAYRYTPADSLLREFRLVNAANVALLRGLTPQQWERVGMHAERGPLTVRQMVEIEANHERDHARAFTDAMRSDG